VVGACSGPRRWDETDRLQGENEFSVDGAHIQRAYLVSTEEGLYVWVYFFISFLFSIFFTIISTPSLCARKCSTSPFSQVSEIQTTRSPNAKDACISSKYHAPSMYKNQIRRPARVNSRQYVHPSSSLPAAASRERFQRRGSSWFLLVLTLCARKERKVEEERTT
jgi:hypothetical protein